MPFFSISSPTSGNATQLQGRAVSATAPATGAGLFWSGSSWAPGNGTTGPTGPSGQDAPKLYSGTTGPASGFGVSGDFFIDTTAGRLYGPKAGGSWGVGLQLQSGPAGPTGPGSTVPGPTGATGPASTVTGPTGVGATGPTGSTGPSGPRGAALLAGNGVPGSGFGTNGDWYIDLASADFYGPKAGGSWGSPTIDLLAITGPTGPQVTGPTGPAGTTTWAGIADKPTTDGITEGTSNLYHTTARAAAAAPVQSVAGRTGTVTLAKADVGLGNVDNTSDANKPVSAAVTTALAGKANTVHDHIGDDVTIQTTMGSATLGAATPAVDFLYYLQADQVGGARDVLLLGSAATQSVPASGNASAFEVVLGSDTRLTNARVPTDGSVTTAKLADGAVTDAKVTSITASKVSDFASAVAAASPEEVVEYQTTSAFPATGNSSLLYIATDPSRAYRWTGSQYVEVGPAAAFVATHTHAAGDITSGTIATARLGSGTADATTFLRGDQTYATPPAGVKLGLILALT